MVHGDGFIIIALKVEHHALAACHLIAYVRSIDRRQWWHRHITTQVKARVRVLVVAASGTVETIMRILLKTIDTIGGGHIRGVAHQSSRAIGILFGQNDFLTPVTSDITHKGRTRTGASMCGP